MTVSTVDPSATFNVLVVCTGNICRSPAAERLLALRLAPDIGVTSAGTHAMVGSPMAVPMVLLLEAAGAAGDCFEARQLNEKLLRNADLVFAMTRGQRADVVDVLPAAVRRSFTLLEFARLLAIVAPEALVGHTPAERLRTAIPLVAAQRTRTVENDDVADPYGKSERAYAVVFQRIQEAVLVISTIIGARVATCRTQQVRQ